MITTISSQVQANGIALTERTAEMFGVKVSYRIGFDWQDEKIVGINITNIEHNGKSYCVDIADKIETLCSKYLDDSFTMECDSAIISFVKKLTDEECNKLEVETVALENGEEPIQESGTYFFDDMQWTMEEHTVCAICEEWDDLMKL